MVNKSGFQYSSSSSGTRSGQQYNTMPHHGGVPQETAVVPEQSLGVHATMPHRRVGSPPVHQQPVVESPVLALKRGGQQVGYHNHIYDYIKEYPKIFLYSLVIFSIFFEQEHLMRGE